MTALPVAFQTSPGKYSFQGTTQLINAYAEKLGSDAKGPLAVMPSDGLVSVCENGNTPNRGMIFLEDLDKAYSVHSSSVYRMTYASGVVTSARIGTIPGNDPVQLSRNQKADPQVVVHCDAGVLVIESDSVSFVTDDDLPDDVVTATVAKGYAAYGEENGKFTLSSLNSAKVIDALDFATFEQKSDKLVRIESNNGELIGFKSTSMEFWRVLDNADFPFAPIGFKSRGLKSAHSVVASDGTLFFVGDDGNVYRLANYDPMIVSTHDVSRLIQADSSPDDISGFGWDRDGHAFVNLSGEDWSRCYDSATKVWHSRKSYGQDRWRANHSIRAWGMNLVGDRLSGKIFKLASDVFTEDSGVMEWGVVSPPMHAFPRGGIIDAIHFDLATGYGVLSGQGSDPKIMLDVSKDGGNTFDQYRELDLATRGNHSARVTARRLGDFGPKGAVFRLRITDPVVRSLVNVDAEVRPLRA